MGKGVMEMREAAKLHLLDPMMSAQDDLVAYLQEQEEIRAVLKGKSGEQRHRELTEVVRGVHEKIRGKDMDMDQTVNEVTKEPLLPQANAPEGEAVVTATTIAEGSTVPDVQTEGEPIEADATAAAEEKEVEITPCAPIRRQGPKVSRNDPCPCGSGKKFKKCHGRGGQQSGTVFATQTVEVSSESGAEAGESERSSEDAPGELGAGQSQENGKYAKLAVAMTGMLAQGAL